VSGTKASPQVGQSIAAVRSQLIQRQRPAGKIEKIGGVDSYIATPEVDYPKTKVVLFLPDVLGITFNNNKVRSLIDSWA
jgi:hypothetical protein